MEEYIGILCLKAEWFIMIKSRKGFQVILSAAFLRIAGVGFGQEPGVGE